MFYNGNFPAQNILTIGHFIIKYEWFMFDNLPYGRLLFKNLSLGLLREIVN